MSEASRSTIDGMMIYLGEMAAPSGGGQRGATAIQHGLKGVSSRSPLAVAVPSPAAGQDVESEFQPPKLVCVLD